MDTKIVKTKAGVIQVLSKKDVVYSLSFIVDNLTGCTLTKDKLVNYLNRTHRYKLIGTPFQLSVWEEIVRIPYGSTKTYSEIAIAIGRPTSYRAVANACGKNKIALIIPCHRVVTKNGLGGYAYGVDVKKMLLEFEQDNPIY